MDDWQQAKQPGRQAYLLSYSSVDLDDLASRGLPMRTGRGGGSRHSAIAGIFRPSDHLVTDLGIRIERYRERRRTHLDVVHRSTDAKSRGIRRHGGHFNASRGKHS